MTSNESKRFVWWPFKNFVIINCSIFFLFWIFLVWWLWFFLFTLGGLWAWLRMRTFCFRFIHLLYWIWSFHCWFSGMFERCFFRNTFLISLFDWKIITIWRTWTLWSFMGYCMLTFCLFVFFLLVIHDIVFLFICLCMIILRYFLLNNFKVFKFFFLFPPLTDKGLTLHIVLRAIPFFFCFVIFNSIIEITIIGSLFLWLGFWLYCLNLCLRACLAWSVMLCLLWCVRFQF